MVIGIPVYLHYCGGELEKISYLVKSTSCCDVGDTEETNNDCCKDEGFIIKNNTDFNLNSFNYKLVKSVFNLSFIPVSNFSLSHNQAFISKAHTEDFPPPKIQNNLLVSITVLRI